MPEKSLLPFLILALGFVWMGLCEWLQRRTSRRSGADVATPGAPRFTVLGLAGLLLCMVAAAIAAYIKWFPK